MKNTFLIGILTTASLVLGLSVADAQTPTATPTPSPTATETPSPTPTPSALADLCVSTQSCIDSALPTAVSTCVTNNNCSASNTDKFALTAGEVADRAIALKKCHSRSHRLTCNLCYQAAKLPVASRFDRQVFHGLLADAARLIELERRQHCVQLRR